MGVDPNIINYLSTGSEKMDWPSQIVDNSGNGTDTFSPDDPNSTFKIRHTRIFEPAGLCEEESLPVVARSGDANTVVADSARSKRNGITFNASAVNQLCHLQD